MGGDSSKCSELRESDMPTERPSCDQEQIARHETLILRAPDVERAKPWNMAPKEDNRRWTDSTR